MKTRALAVFLASFGAAAPAAGQTYEFANLGFRLEAPEAFDVVQEGIVTTVANEDGTQRIEIQPFSVADREASREERARRWLELGGYLLDGSEEVRGDGSVIVTAEGGDAFSFVMVRDVYVDSDGGLRIIVYADPLEMDATLAIVDSIEITDPSPLLDAGRLAGVID